MARMKKILLSLVLLSVQINLVFTQCDAPSAFAELNIGNVRAMIGNGGDFWFDGENSVYESPQSNPITGATGNRTMFAGGIWMSASDNAGNLKVAAMSFRNQGFEFYPGPIDNITGNTDYQTCTFYDQIWEVTDLQVQQHIVLSNSFVPVPTNQIHPNILLWPGKGNSNITAVAIIDNLAPFIDVNSNGIYEPSYGDYPKIQGDQALFWVINDIGGIHEIYNGAPLKVQVQMLAYAYNSGLLVNTTIYDCKVINKSFGHLNNFRFGLFMDPDILDPTSNYVGCDTLRDASFAYLGNSDNMFHPASSVSFLNQKMSSFNHFINGTLTNLFSDPTNDEAVANFLNARFSDGTPFSLTGAAGPTAPIRFIFPGNPSNPNEWSMNHSVQATPADYRTLQTTGKQTLNAWTSFDVSWAVHTSFTGDHQTTNFYDQVAAEIDSIKTLFNNFDTSYDYSHLTSTSFLDIPENKVSFYPNPSKNTIRLNYGDLKLIEANIYSLDGKLIQIELGAIIDVSSLSTGIYLLKIDFESGSVVKKILKD
jgi:hypothetical protein